MFYDKTKGVWSDLQESTFRKFIKTCLAVFNVPALETQENVESVLKEIKTDITISNMGMLYPGISFKDGTLLIGGDPDVTYPYHPEFQVKTYLPINYKESYNMFPETETYFKTLVYFNPTQLHMLRL